MEDDTTERWYYDDGGIDSTSVDAAAVRDAGQLALWDNSWSGGRSPGSRRSQPIDERAVSNPKMADVMADVANYTNIMPVRQVSEVVS